MKKSKRGRPRKYFAQNSIDEREKLIELAVQLFYEPYDDRRLRDPDSPSINAVAATMNLNASSIRKMLITAGYYTTSMSRKVQELDAEGLSCEQISKELNLSRASVNNYLPLKKGKYKLKASSSYSEQSLRYRRRCNAVRSLHNVQNAQEQERCFWNIITDFENYPFKIFTEDKEDKDKFYRCSYRIIRNEDGTFSNLVVFIKDKVKIFSITIDELYSEFLESKNKNDAFTATEKQLILSSVFSRWRPRAAHGES